MIGADYSGGSESGSNADYINNSENNTIISGTSNNDTINNSGSTVTINADTGDDSISNSGANVSIDSGKGDDSISNSGDNVTIIGGNGNDEISNSSNNVTIDGGNGSNIINLNGNINKGLLVKVGDGSDVIKLSSDVSSFNVEDFGTNDEIQLSNSPNKLTTIVGGIVVGAVSIGGIEKIATVETSWSTDTNSIAYNRSTIAGAKLDGTKITYNATSGNENLFTITGIKSTVGVALKNRVVTLSKEALNGVTGEISISDGYVLALGSDVTKTVTTEAGWSLNGTTATYKAAAASAGYKLADNKISYVGTSGGETLTTVSGVKSTNGLSLNGKVVTVSAESLNQGEVTIGSGYTLKLGNDVDQVKTTAAGWSLSGTTATYKVAASSAGYKLSDNKISYVGSSGGNILVTVTGVKSLSGISLKNKVVTVSAAALGTENVSISGSGYTLALNSNVDTTKEDISAWTTLSGGNVAYYTAGSGSCYALNSKKTSITYNAEVTPATKAIEFSGIKGKPTVSGSTVKLSASNFKSDVKIVKNAGDYKLSLSGNFKNKTFNGTTNDDIITSSSSNLVIKGGKGDDSITGGANDDKLYGETGDDILRGGKGNDSMNGGTGDDSIFGDVGNDSILGGKGDDYLNGGENDDKLYGETGDDTLIGGAGNDSLWGDAGSDTFLYNSGDGKDVFFGIDNTDILEITGTFSASYDKSKKEIYFKVGSTSNAITLKDFTKNAPRSPRIYSWGRKAQNPFLFF